MKQNTIINIVIPALLLISVALWILATGQMLLKVSEQPTEQQLLVFKIQLDKNELSVERLREIVRADLAHDASLKKVHQAVNEFIRWAAIIIVTITGWLVFGCYRFSKKRQQVAATSIPRSGEVDVPTRNKCS